MRFTLLFTVALLVPAQGSARGIPRGTAATLSAAR